MLYHDEQKKVAQNYALIITKKISKNKYEAITKNYISKKMSFEVISTKLTKIRKIKIVKISTESNDNAEIVNTPMSKITIELNENLNLCKNDIFRII
jgi:hypothetical protein